MTLFWTNGVATLHQADAREIPLPDKSVHMVVTSPPYWGLRDYGLGAWQGGDAECGHERLAKDRQKPHGLTDRKPGTAAYGGDAIEAWPNNTCGHCGATQQAAGIGLEPTLGEWVENIIAVGREVWRVLRDDGTFWLNLGDAYAGSGKGTGGKNSFQTSNAGSFFDGPRVVSDIPAKNLMGQPWRMALALQDTGWILRSAIVWHKPNPMPESTKDRPTSAYEMVFLLVKQGRYFYDAEAIRQPNTDWTLERMRYPKPGHPRRDDSAQDSGINANAARNYGPGSVPTGANARNVWTIPTQGRPDAHFATFPDELPRRCILAGTSERGVCGECGSPWVRIVEKSGGNIGKQSIPSGTMAQGKNTQPSWDTKDGSYQVQTLGWQPTCGCNAAVVPAVVLDPFVGSGTTCAVAQQLGRRSVGLDLNPEYLDGAKRRINKTPMPTIRMDLYEAGLREPVLDGDAYEAEVFERLEKAHQERMVL